MQEVDLSLSIKEIDRKLERLFNSRDYLYGSAYADQFLLHDPKSLPRFGHLARKALLHYGGEHYNPHKHGLTVETFIREIISEVVRYKVFYRTQGYDWEWIDNILKRSIGGCLQIDIPYSQARIDAGFKHNYRAAVLTDERLPH